MRSFLPSEREEVRPPALWVRRGGCEQHTRRLAERRGGGRRGRAATVFGRGGTDLRQNFARCGGDIVGG